MEQPRFPSLHFVQRLHSVVQDRRLSSLHLLRQPAFYLLSPGISPFRFLCGVLPLQLSVATLGELWEAVGRMFHDGVRRQLGLEWG